MDLLRKPHDLSHDFSHEDAPFFLDGKRHS